MNRIEIEDAKKVMENELNSIKKELSGKLFPGLGVEDKFNLIGIDWKIVDIIDQGYVCFGDTLEKREFDESSNNYGISSLREYLGSDIYDRICDEIGAENIISFERDLISLDGQDEYGKVNDFVSIISIDEYRKYRKLIPNYGEPWWTLTPDSTKCNGDVHDVRCVGSDGSVLYGGCGWCDLAVRPFCLFSSTIFQS